MTRTIQREFLIENGYETLPPVTLGHSWSSFMNTYAVWPPDQGDQIVIRRSLLLQAGYYWILGAVDNSGSVSINGSVIGLYNFGANISRTDGTLWPYAQYQERFTGTTPGPSTRIYHPGGLMSVVISATNFGGPRGVAVTISADVLTERARFTFDGKIVNNTFAATPGALIWSTRSPDFFLTARYLVTMPCRANITAHVWGAGGGGGGMDAGTVGGIAAPGLYNTTTFQVDKGDQLEVFVGSGGTGGSSSSGSAPGGPAGRSRILINGDSTKSFNGGAGSAAGPGGSSGGGGGGGGASGVLVNNVPVLVAGGGAGGGGAGNDGNGSAQYARRDASINNNAMDNKIIVRSSNYNINYRDWTANYFILNGTRRNSINRGHNLAVINASTLALESYNVYDTWASPTGSGLETALNAVGTGKIIVLFNADACSITGTARNILQTKYGATQTATWIQVRRSHAFIGIAGASFTPVESFSDSSPVEVSRPFTGIVATDYRGKNGESRAGDGGGAGGGGGGYPGGEGGAVFFGDASGFAGQCGGNFPIYSATTGTSTLYYKPGYAAGGSRGGGRGQDGRVFLLIEPVALMSVKVAGEWKQIDEALVKISGSWKSIETVYVKIDNSWRVVEGSGSGDITLVGNAQNYGQSVRSYG